VAHAGRQNQIAHLGARVDAADDGRHAEVGDGGEEVEVGQRLVSAHAGSACPLCVCCSLPQWIYVAVLGAR